NGGQFTTLILGYSTNGSTFTQFAQFTNLQTFTSFTALSATLPTAANNQSTLFIQFAFTGSTNNADQNHTYLDNIQISAVPEPSTVVSGVLGVIGLCWHMRRRLFRSLVGGRLLASVIGSGEHFNCTAQCAVKRAGIVDEIKAGSSIIRQSSARC